MKKLPKIENQQIDEHQLLEDYKRTFNSPHGMRVYKDIINRCGIFQTTFTGTSKTFFLEGERSIGLYLLNMMGLLNIQGLEIIKDEINEY